MRPGRDASLSEALSQAPAPVRLSRDPARLGAVGRASIRAPDCGR
jgi:hypothetical protein